MHDHDTPSIPYGYCHCGCGEKTNLADRTRPKHGHVKGEPMKYLRGHIHKRHDIAPPNPSGLCLCGCGEKTSVARMTNIERGHLAGHPVRYIAGHDKRIHDRYTIDPITGCWLWNLSCNENGYAYQAHNGVTKRVHVLNYIAKYGPVPDGLELDHLCHTRHCVNPDHLEPVTHEENMRRRAERNRHAAT